MKHIVIEGERKHVETNSDGLAWYSDCPYRKGECLLDSPYIAYWMKEEVLK